LKDYEMNNGQLYLAWLRTTAPSLYSQAVRKATGKQHTLGGLTDNLLNRALSPGLTQSFLGDDDLDEIDVTGVSMDQPVTTNLFIAPVDTTFDTSTIAAPSAVNVAPLPNVPVPSTPAAAAPSSNIFANILTAVASIGSTVVTASQQSALIALNTQRAAQGLPPVNAAGQVITAAGTATTSPALLAFENAITGGAGGSLLPIILIGGVLAYFLFGRKSTV
jgi:hypothetical protein